MPNPTRSSATVVQIVPNPAGSGLRSRRCLGARSRGVHSWLTSDGRACRSRCPPRPSRRLGARRGSRRRERSPSRRRAASRSAASAATAAGTSSTSPCSSSPTASQIASTAPASGPAVARSPESSAAFTLRTLSNSNAIAAGVSRSSSMATPKRSIVAGSAGWKPESSTATRRANASRPARDRSARSVVSLLISSGER